MIQFLCLLALAQPSPALIEQKTTRGFPEVYEMAGGNRGHSFRVSLQQATFKARGRKVEVRTEGGADSAYLEGRPLNGIFVAWPEMKADLKGFLERNCTEVRVFEVWVDGKKAPIAKNQYDDLLDPNLGEGYCWSWLSKDGKKLVVKMMGSDAAGSYTVIWTFRGDKVVKREITHNC